MHPNGNTPEVSLLELARSFVRRGFSVIPIPFKEKAPRLKGWQKARITEPELPSYFGFAPGNIGLLLGEPSRWVIDIDLDTGEAVRAAARVLPATCTFGRESRPVSHYLYRAPDTATRKFKDPKTGAMILEIRSTGQQTVAPGSTHPSGERVRWDREGDPTEIAADDLGQLAARAAAAALLGAHWPGKGSRNDAAMALAGTLLRAGWSVGETEQFVAAVAESSSDDEAAARVSTVAPTKAKLEAGMSVTGEPRLAELIDPAVVSKALEWIGASGGESGPAAATTQATPPEDPLGAVLATGTFYRAQETAFFVRKDGGDALEVPSRRFEAHVARVCRLRRGGRALKDTVAALADHAMNSGERVGVEYLSAIGPKGEVFTHLGNGSVVRFAGGKFELVPNGTACVLFDAERGMLPLHLDRLKQAHRPSDLLLPTLRRVLLERLPAPGGHLTAREQEAAVLAAWLGTFVRPWSPGRPILLLLGPPGCGKSVTQRLLAKLVFGPEGDTAGGTMLDRTMKDIAAAAVHRPLVTRDDVNDLPAGAIDVLCRLATGTTFEVANYNETLSLGSYRGRAQIVLSAYSPSWLQRADLMSRFLIVEFAKGDRSGLTERQRIAEVLGARDAIWAETLMALTHLAGDLPQRTPITRFDDFERALAPMMRAAGYGPEFDAALSKMPVVGALLAARSDPLLGILLRLAQDPEFCRRWFTAAELADRIAAAMGVRGSGREPHLTSVVRDSQRLGKLLAKIEREGGAVVNVEKRDGHNHVKLWRITPRFPAMPLADEPRTQGNGGSESEPLGSEEKEEVRSGVTSGGCASQQGPGGPFPPSPPEVPMLE